MVYFSENFRNLFTGIFIPNKKETKAIETAEVKLRRDLAGNILSYKSELFSHMDICILLIKF